MFIVRALKKELTALPIATAFGPLISVAIQFVPITMVNSICSSFWLLADESSDLSQAKKEVTVAKGE